MSVLEIYRGLPGSGKTYNALHKLAEWPRGQVARVNRSDLREHVFNTVYQPDSQDFEDELTALQHAMIDRALARDLVVICDDTNLYDEHLLALVQLARDAGAGWAVRNEFTTVPLGVCIARDATRPPARRVGADIITAMFDKHLAAHYPAPLPTPEGA